jgi:hypothetical protein
MLLFLAVSSYFPVLFHQNNAILEG